MASNAFRIIHDVELGKPYLLPECLGNDLARGNDGLEGRGTGKKQMTTRNEFSTSLISTPIFFNPGQPIPLYR